MTGNLIQAHTLHGLPTQSSVARPPDVMVQLERLQAAVQDLEALTKALHERLAPVMGPPRVASNAQGNGHPETDSCSLAVALRDLGRRVEMVAGAVRDGLLAQLEL